jgi:hypothetical protein
MIQVYPIRLWHPVRPPSLLLVPPAALNRKQRRAKARNERRSK